MKPFYYLFLIFFICSCTSKKNSETTIRGHYTSENNGKHLSDNYLYLVKYNDYFSTDSVIDSCKLKNNEFIFSLKIKDSCIYILAKREFNTILPISEIFLRPNDKLYLKLNFRTDQVEFIYPLKMKISGIFSFYNKHLFDLNDSLSYFYSNQMRVNIIQADKFLRKKEKYFIDLISKSDENNSNFKSYYNAEVKLNFELIRLKLVSYAISNNKLNINFDSIPLYFNTEAAYVSHYKFKEYLIYALQFYCIYYFNGNYLDERFYEFLKNNYSGESRDYAIMLYLKYFYFKRADKISIKKIMNDFNYICFNRCYYNYTKSLLK